MVNKVLIKFHRVNKRVTLGWNTVAPYFYLAAFSSSQEVILAKLFPNLFVESTLGVAITYIAAFLFIYRIGSRHEQLERMERENMKVAKRLNKR